MTLGVLASLSSLLLCPSGLTQWGQQICTSLGHSAYIQRPQCAVSQGWVSGSGPRPRSGLVLIQTETRHGPDGLLRLSGPGLSIPSPPPHAFLVLEDLVCSTCQGTGRNDGCLHGVGYQEPERASLTLTLFLLTPRPLWLSDAHNSTIKASFLWGKPNWDFSPY